METGDIEIGKETEKLINYALFEIEKKYGTGEGDGQSPRRYHNKVHAQNVIDAAGKIAQLAVKKGKIKNTDTPLIKIAPAFHDIEQDLGSGLNEEESARKAEEQMRKTGFYSDEEIRKVREMIMATRVHYDEGGMSQFATENYMTQIIADADLSNLGNPYELYWDRARRLLEEVKNTRKPSGEDIKSFMRGQISFLQSHRFYTEEARALFPYKKDNIKTTQRNLK